MESNLRPAEKPPTGAPTEVTVLWKPEVCLAADTVNNGTPVPTLAGRMYLFGGAMGSPVAGDGQLEVRLFNEDRAGPDGRPQFLGRWHLDNRGLAAMLSKDTIGWGYTLLLPWVPYDPAIVHVHLTVAYQSPHGGAPLFNQSGPILLHHPLVHSSSRQTPVVGQPAGPPAGTAPRGGTLSPGIPRSQAPPGTALP
jgi:hypothetical protein